MNFISQRCDRRFFRVSKRHGLRRRAMINVGIYTFQIPMVLQQVLIVGQAGRQPASHSTSHLSRDFVTHFELRSALLCTVFFALVSSFQQRSHVIYAILSPARFRISLFFRFCARGEGERPAIF